VRPVYLARADVQQECQHGLVSGLSGKQVQGWPCAADTRHNKKLMDNTTINRVVQDGRVLHHP
jgi:hypothetical protein